jgi:exosortase/archaeosortase family protein
VLYACLIYRSPWRRAAFMLAACIVPIIANGFRSLGIVVLGHLLGSAQAVAADHVIYGWGFFSAIILALILAGLPFREDAAAPPPARRPGGEAPASAAALWLAAGLVLAASAIGPAVARAVDNRTPTLPAIAEPGFVPGPDCTTLSASAGVQRFSCAGFRLTATIRVFSPRANPAILIAAQRSAGAETEDAIVGGLSGLHSPPHAWRLVEASKPDRVCASALWIDGDPDLGGLAARLRQARNSLFGGGLAPVLVAVRIDGDARPMDRAREAIRAFIAAQGDLDRRVVALARAAGG